VAYFDYTIPSYSTNVACVFYIQNQQMSNTLMVASLTPIALSLSPQALSQMYLQQNATLASLDLFGTINGDSQLVNVAFPSGMSNNRVYLAFFNLDLPSTLTAKTYRLRLITSSTYSAICFSCSWGLTLTAGCQCSPCPPGKYGKTCGYLVETMQKDQQYISTFYSATASYFRIADPPATIIVNCQEITPTNSIKLYLQFERIPGDLAGPLNTYYSSTNLSSAKLVTTRQVSFTVVTQGRNIMLALVSSSNTQSTNVVISF
jgi:hypothetical protein